MTSPSTAAYPRPKYADPTDSLSVNTLTGSDSVLVSGVAGVLQVLVDGTTV